MYFLRAALSGMRRRFTTSLLTIFGSAALLTAVAAIGLWSFWLGWEQKNLQASRTAAVFVDSIDNTIIENVLRAVEQVPGVSKARIISTEEFSYFLQTHFPDLFAAIQDLDIDVIPRTLEVILPGVAALDLHKQAIQEITQIPNVVRVDDTMATLGKALSSLHWLSLGGAILGFGLWLVLLILCLGHYQNILYTDAQEIQLIRSFGATKFGIFMPWLLEAILQAFTGALFALIFLSLGKGMLIDVYNQFFGTLGYEPFQMDFLLLAKVAAGVFIAGLLAHGLGGVYALLRGNIV